MKDRFAAEWDEKISNIRHKGRRVGTIWAEWDTGEGDATLTVEFLDQNPLFRADVLGDVIGVLQREYEESVKKLNAGFSRD